LAGIQAFDCFSATIPNHPMHHQQDLMRLFAEFLSNL
jgi:hypothetical protein